MELVRSTVEAGGAPAVLLAAAESEKAFEALLASYITGAWTIFETMAGDLWEAAVNEKPNLLAQLKGDSKRLKKGRSVFGSSYKADREKESKEIKLDVLQFYQWDLRDKMGIILKQKFSFSALDGIREAYASAFCEEANLIDEALSDNALDAMSALRNVITHRAGVVDREYIARTKYIPSLPKGTEGKPLEFRGKFVSHTIGEMIFCAGKLLGAVDDWIATH